MAVLLETLTLTVAPAIAKSILRVWLKDHDFATDISSTFVEIISAKTSDVVARQKGRRVFEEIGEKVAEALRPIFELESAGLDEGSQAAVALAVAETFGRTPIDPALLAERNLEPMKLARHLLNTLPGATQHFSTTEAELYRRIITEASGYVVRIASQLPNFTEQTFAEVLKRQSDILSIATEILEEVRRIWEVSQKANPELTAAIFEKEYREAVGLNLDKLELFGVDVSGANKRHRLSVAYITLSVRTEDTARTELLQKLGGDKDEDVDDWVMAPADVVLSQQNRLLLRGLAGSGKTTLLQWIAVNSAHESFGEQLATWNGTLPFFIRLRQFANEKLPSPREFPGLVASASASEVPAGWVRDQLKSGRAIVLIDGVDEVPEGQRATVREWLADLVRSYDQCRFIVTSRPTAIEADWLAREGFKEAELQLMELSDVDVFIDHWHAAVHEELQDAGEKAELSGYARTLKVEIRKSRPLRNLVTSPLICAMVCALYRDRHKQLPADRIELYRAGCEMLLERRDKERGIIFGDYPNVGYRQKLVLLQDLAYWMLDNGWSMVTRERAQECFDRRLPNLQGISPSATSEGILKLFLDRTGLLREPVVGYGDFTHRTFQEYFAAHEALERGNIGALVRNAHNDQWREVIILAAGLAKTSEREEIIRGLIERGDKEPELRHQLHLLAVACLETSVELGQEVQAKVAKRLKSVVPPRNLAEAKEVSAAGELAIPYLARGWNENANTAAACVRALALIGGDSAFEALQQFAIDWRAPVIGQLYKAWQSFDQEEYLKKIIRNNIISRNAGFVRIPYTSYIPKLLPILKESKDLFITIERSNNLNELSLLSSLDELKVLELVGYILVNQVDWASEMAQLEDLRIYDCRQLVNIRPLSNLINLRSLTMCYCSSLSDIKPLSLLENLETLTLLHVHLVKDVSPLLNLPKLRSVRADGRWKFRSDMVKAFKQRGVEFKTY